MWLRPLATVSGPLLAALLLAPWLYTMTLSEGSVAGMMRDIAPKLGGGGEHGARPPGLHLLLLPLLIFPASIGLAPAFADGWRALRAPRDDDAFAGARFLVAWILPTWLVFELATTKLAHYTLPVYPAIALLAAAGLLRWLDQPTRSRRISLAASLFLGSLGLIAAAVALTQWSAAAAAISVGAALTAFSLALSMIVARAPAATVAIATALCAALALNTMSREVLAPRATHVLVTRAALDTLPARGEGPLLVVGYREPSLVFATGTDTILRQGPEAGRIATPGQTVLVEARERISFEERLAARGLAFQPAAAPVLGRNYSNGDDVILQAGRVIE
jgi:4-amino-4-deoxy-L-arabinose transferase-like glycosyltransferase